MNPGGTKYMRQYANGKGYPPEVCTTLCSCFSLASPPPNSGAVSLSSSSTLPTVFDLALSYYPPIFLVIFSPIPVSFVLVTFSPEFRPSRSIRARSQALQGAIVAGCLLDTHELPVCLADVRNSAVVPMSLLLVLLCNCGSLLS